MRHLITKARTTEQKRGLEKLLKEQETRERETQGNEDAGEEKKADKKRTRRGTCTRKSNKRDTRAEK